MCYITKKLKVPTVPKCSKRLVNVSTHSWVFYDTKFFPYKKCQYYLILMRGAILENWKNLIYNNVNYGNKFIISTMGRLKNKNTGTIYKLSQNKNGYLQVTVSCGSRNKKLTVKIHRAVAETFIPNPNNLPQVNHKDGNKLHNVVENLEWITNQANIIHAVKIGLRKYDSISGEYNVNNKLKQEDVQYIRTFYTPRHKQFGCRSLARKFGVSHRLIELIIQNKRWKIK